jgi:hypothetical protein
METRGIWKHAKDLSIRSKLLIGYLTAGTFFFAIVGLWIHSIVKQTIEANIESELNNTTKIILSMVKTAADASIKSYLRAVAEKNRDVLEGFYKQYERGY